MFRLLDAAGVQFAEFATRGHSIGYVSFLRGAVLFFVVAIATGNFAWSKKQNV